jgi:hypothetical protein
MDSCPVYNGSKYKVYQLQCKSTDVSAKDKKVVNHQTPFNKIPVNYNNLKQVCVMNSSEHCKITNVCALEKK